MKPGRLDVGVVGAGRVGAVLASALRAADHRVVAASGLSEASVGRLDTLLPGVDRVDPEAVVRAADLVLLAVPDDALEPLVAGLASVGAWRPGQIAVHTSGRHGLASLEPAARIGVTGLAIHPAMTFTGTSLDLVRMREAVFVITAPAAGIPIAQALVIEWGGESVVVDDADRPRYHAALVHGANHVVTAVSQAMSVLADAGVEDPGRLLAPLVRASLDGVLAEPAGTLISLTGPVVRGDAGTVAVHLDALAREPETRAAYRAMARATAELAVGAGRIGEAQYAELMNVLGDEP